MSGWVETDNLKIFKDQPSVSKKGGKFNLAFWLGLVLRFSILYQIGVDNWFIRKFGFVDPLWNDLLWTISDSIPSFTNFHSHVIIIPFEKYEIYSNDLCINLNSPCQIKVSLKLVRLNRIRDGPKNFCN